VFRVRRGEELGLLAAISKFFVKPLKAYLSTKLEVECLAKRLKVPRSSTQIE
jgi:hypothetical protein